MEACLYIGGSYLAPNKNWEGKKIQNYFKNDTVAEKYLTPYGYIAMIS